MNLVYHKKWILPVIHGFIDMKSKDSLIYKCVDFDLFTKKFSLILIARRSRCYAGVRYPRRGIDREGNVANFVETEQIVYCPNKSFDDKPIFSSFVFNRGSIPVFWS
jgi:hypothetical protein